MKKKVALVDDHKLMRRGLAEYIDTLDGYEVILEAGHGGDFIRQLNQCQLPDLVLLDIQMPVMDGYSTAYWLTMNHPAVKVAALSLIAEEKSILRMIQNGATGYILKDIGPSEFEHALDELILNGCYYSEEVTTILVNALKYRESERKKEQADIPLKEQERIFLHYVCGGLIYKEIAHKMNRSVRTIDGYRDALFEKLKIRSKAALVVYAMEHGIKPYKGPI